MKSVCMIGNFASFSGAFEVFRNVSRHAKANGYSTHYICHANRIGEIVPDLSMFDTAECIPNDGVSREAYGSLLAAAANKFDVVHTSLLPQDWRFLFKRHCTRPMVETYHSPDGWKRCWRQYKYRLKGGHEKLPDATVGVSNGLARKIEQDLQSPVHAILNGINIPDAAAATGPYVTFCGRISADKGLDEWITIAQIIRNRVPSARFQWIGALSPQYDPFLMKCLQAAAPWLELVGFQEDPSPYYRRSRCLLLTSPSEGLPMTILEAHAHGIPSVAYDVGDVKEAAGHLAEYGQIRGLVMAIDNLFHSPSFYRTSCEFVRQHAIDNFSIEAMGAKYLELYEAILTKSPAVAA